MEIQKFIHSSSEERKIFKELKFEESLASLNEADFKKFCDALVECENLEKLVLKDNEIYKFGPNRFTFLCESIAKCQKLSSLSIVKNGLGYLNSKRFQTFCTLIDNCNNLRELNLLDNDFTKLNEEQFKLLSKTISDLKELKKLTFYEPKQNINNSNFQIFCTNIANCKSLEELSIDSIIASKLENDSIRALCLLIDNCKKLRSIYMNVNEKYPFWAWNEDVFKTFLGALSKASNLNEIGMGYGHKDDRVDEVKNIIDLHKKASQLLQTHSQVAWQSDADYPLEEGKLQPGSLKFLSSNVIKERGLRTNKLPLELRIPIDAAKMVTLPKEELLKQLFECITANNIDLFKLLIAERKDVNLNQKNTSNQTLLHMASVNHAGRKPNIEFLKILLENGADPNVGDGNGWTPLHYAAYQGQKECIEVYKTYHNVNWQAETNAYETINDLVEKGKLAFPGAEHDAVLSELSFRSAGRAHR